jgi:YegS/Rv2252/BmrU family lipid kinase
MTTPQRYPLIFNPKARSQKADRVRRFLMTHANHFALYATNHGEEARELAAEFAARGEPVVIAAGGDGTLNAVVSGLAGSRTALGILPSGTMNVFARELGIPFGRLDKAFEVITEGHIREIDLFTANGSPFIQMAGVGFDARVIEETPWESKKLLGPLAYLVAAVKVLGEKPPEMEVVFPDGRRVTGVAVLAGNGSLYGGQFRLFRKADNRDSRIDVLVFREHGYRFVLDSLAGLARGGVDLSESAGYFQADSFTVTCGVETPVEIDGEWLGRFKEVRFTESARRLRVLAPPENQDAHFVDAIRSLINWPSAPAELQSTRSNP